MAKTVFNRKDIDFTKEPMFFGEDQNVQRYDVFKYPQFDKLNQTMIGYFWRPEEVSLQKDRADFQNFRPEQKHIFTSNLKYQTLLDSVQGRGPSLMFLPYVSNPELEGCIVTWDFFETIHSRSYTHIMKNVYPDPSEVFDTIVTGVGASVLSGDLSLEAAEATKEAAMASELEFSGVSLDTEAAQLLEQQQAFQASARILATAKQLFQTLLDVV